MCGATRRRSTTVYEIPIRPFFRGIKGLERANRAVRSARRHSTAPLSPLFRPSRRRPCASSVIIKVSLPTVRQQDTLGSLTEAQTDRALGRTAASRYDLSVLPLIPSHGEISALRGYLRGPNPNATQRAGSPDYNRELALARLRESHFALRMREDGRAAPLSPDTRRRVAELPRSMSAPNLHEMNDPEKASRRAIMMRDVPPLPKSPTGSVMTLPAMPTSRPRRRPATPKNKGRADDDADDTASIASSGRRSRRSPSLSLSSMRKTLERMRSGTATPPLPSPTTRGEKAHAKPFPIVRTFTDPTLTPTRPQGPLDLGRNSSNSSLARMHVGQSTQDLSDTSNVSSMSLPLLPHPVRKDSAPGRSNGPLFYRNELVHSPTTQAASETSSVSPHLLSEQLPSSDQSSERERSLSASRSTSPGASSTLPGAAPTPPPQPAHAPDESEMGVQYGTAVSDAREPAAPTSAAPTDARSLSSLRSLRQPYAQFPRRVSARNPSSSTRSSTTSFDASSESSSQTLERATSPVMDAQGRTSSPLPASPTSPTHPNSFTPALSLTPLAAPRASATSAAPVSEEEHVYFASPLPDDEPSSASVEFEATEPPTDVRPAAAAAPASQRTLLNALTPAPVARTPGADVARTVHDTSVPHVSTAPSPRMPRAPAQAAPAPTPASAVADQDTLIVQIEDAFQQIMNVAIASQAANVPIPRRTAAAPGSSAPPLPRRMALEAMSVQPTGRDVSGVKPDAGLASQRSTLQDSGLLSADTMSVLWRDHGDTSRDAYDSDATEGHVHAVPPSPQRNAAGAGTTAPAAAADSSDASQPHMRSVNAIPDAGTPSAVPDAPAGRAERSQSTRRSLARLSQHLTQAASDMEKSQANFEFHSQLEEFAAQQASLRGTIESSRAEIMELRKNLWQFHAALQEDGAPVPDRTHLTAAQWATGADSKASVEHLDRRLAHMLNQCDLADRVTSAVPDGGTATAALGPSRTDRASTRAAPHDVGADWSFV